MLCNLSQRIENLREKYELQMCTALLIYHKMVSYFIRRHRIYILRHPIIRLNTSLIACVKTVVFYVGCTFANKNNTYQQDTDCLNKTIKLSILAVCTIGSNTHLIRA